MYTPYFYIIQHIKTKKYYAGVRYSKNARPSELLDINGYHTSSLIVNNIIKNEGLSIFIIRKIKIFSVAEDAINYETRFLIKVNARNNSNFYNISHNRGGIYLSPNNLKNIMLLKYGVEHYSQTDTFNKQYKSTCLERYGVEHTLSVQRFKEKSKITCLEKYGTEYASSSTEIKNKVKNTIIKKYNTDSFFKSTVFKEKTKITCLEKYGVEHYSKSEDFKHKASISQIGEKHHLFKGYFVTPHGTFGSATEAQNTLKFINRKSVQKWCLQSNITITKASYNKNKYLYSFYDSSVIGLTPADLGFSFISS